jgi:hypothetical protein
MLGTTAEGEGTAQGPGGSFCGGGANVMAMAAEKATKRLLGELGERFSNSPRLRAASGPEASPAAYSAPPARSPLRAESSPEAPPVTQASAKAPPAATKSEACRSLLATPERPSAVYRTDC